MFNRVLGSLVVVISVLLGLTGCGGGGGGGGTPTILYSTDWTNRAQNPGGMSERILIYSPGGSLSHPAIILNQDLPAVQSISITGLTAGQYRLHVDLYSGRDLTGTLNGTYDTSITLQGGLAVATAVGVAATKIVVVPTSATITSQQSQQFYVGATTATNQGAFVSPTDILWSSTPAALGSIDPNSGLFTAQATGNGTGSVTAKQVSTGLTGSGSVTVTPVVIQHSKWTVLVYMNAANDLFSFSDPNIYQMQTVADNPQVRFVVQWKQYQTENPTSSFDGTRRYLIKSGSNSQNVSQLVQNMGTGIDMGNPQTLQDFIAWGKANYPADRYCLVIWDHGNGWKRSFDGRQITRGVSYDDEFSSSINTWQLQLALGNNRFDVVAWDASLMQMLEVAYEIRDKASFVVGSEESPPGAGYPYDTIFGPLRSNPDLDTLTFTKSFVDGMLAAYGAQSDKKITQSVVDTSKLGALAQAVSALGTKLIGQQTHLLTLIPPIRAASQSYSLNASFGRYFYDLFDVTQRIQSDTAGNPQLADVNAACGPVLAAITAAVPYQRHNVNSPGSNGIAIDFSPSSSFSSYAADYGLLRFGQDTSWGAWLGVAP